MKVGNVPPTVERDLDRLDACVFTGDGFHSREGLERLRWFLARWSKEADSIGEMLRDADTTNGQQAKSADA